MNRIQAAFDKMEKLIQSRIDTGQTTAEKVVEIGVVLDMELGEYCRFQELKTLLVAEGKITLEEGMTIYTALGNMPSVFNSQPVHVKAVLTELLKEMLS